jgi:hypothetical protein
MVVIRLPKNQLKLFELIFCYKETQSIVNTQVPLYFSGVGDKQEILNNLSLLKDLIEKMDNEYILVERETEYSTIQDKNYHLV